MRYQIVIGTSFENLVRSVNALIEEGWQPYEGISRMMDMGGGNDGVAYESDRLAGREVYVQLMVFR